MNQINNISQGARLIKTILVLSDTARIESTFTTTSVDQSASKQSKHQR